MLRVITDENNNHDFLLDDCDESINEAIHKLLKNPIKKKEKIKIIKKEIKYPRLPKS